LKTRRASTRGDYSCCKIKKKSTDETPGDLKGLQISSPSHPLYIYIYIYLISKAPLYLFIKSVKKFINNLSDCHRLSHSLQHYSKKERKKEKAIEIKRKKQKKKKEEER